MPELSWGDCCRHQQETRPVHVHYLRIPGAAGLWECEDCIEIDRARRLQEQALLDATDELLEAVKAGERYLRQWQERGQRGVMIEAEEHGELERLFQDWHEKTHAAISKAGGGE